MSLTTSPLSPPLCSDHKVDKQGPDFDDLKIFKKRPINDRKNQKMT
jgi:hypothetical protein